MNDRCPPMDDRLRRARRLLTKAWDSQRPEWTDKTTTREEGEAASREAMRLIMQYVADVKGRETR
jgi:hypothetical protein